MRVVRRGRAEGVICFVLFLLFLGILIKIRFVLDEDFYLVFELDGVRIFFRSIYEFLYEVLGEVFIRVLRDLGYRFFSIIVVLG